MNNRKKNNIVKVYRFELNVEIDRLIDRKIQEFVRNVLEKEFQQKNYEIAIVLTSDSYIRKLNKQYLEHDWATDILCFPYSKGKKLVSDIIISVEKAKNQSRVYNTTLDREIFFLIAHGILHLFGWDDSSDNERKKMWAKQKELLKWL